MTFGPMEGRPIVAEFNSGEISSEAGLMLIHLVDQHYGLSQQITSCFRDHRDPSQVKHTLEAMVAQRLYGLLQGYEDLNEHEVLRFDVMLRVVVEKLDRRRRESWLTNKS